MPCNCHSTARRCDNRYCSCFVAGVACVASCYGGVVHPFSCNNRVPAAAPAPPPPPAAPPPPAPARLPAGATLVLLPTLAMQCSAVAVVVALLWFWFMPHIFPFLCGLAGLSIRLLLSFLNSRGMLALPKNWGGLIAFLAAIFAVLVYFFGLLLSGYRYYTVKDCLEYPVVFNDLNITDLVPHPYLEQITDNIFHRPRFSSKERIDVIAGPVYQGKTTIVKKMLNGRKHTIFVDLTKVELADVEMRLTEAFAGNPRGLILTTMQLDFNSALETLSHIAHSYNEDEKLIVVIDGAMVLYGGPRLPDGKIDAPLLKGICTDLSPKAVVLLICSGSTIISKAPHVSHVGRGRTHVKLSKPIDNTTSMVEWFLRQPGTEALTRDVAVGIANVLDGNFNDYERLGDYVEDGASFTDAMNKFKNSMMVKLIKTLHLDETDVENAVDQGIPEIRSWVQRFEFVRKLALNDTSDVKATNAIVESLVADDILVPYPDEEIAFESKLKKVVARELVQEEEILERIAVFKSLLNSTSSAANSKLS